MNRERLTMSFYIDMKRERNGEAILQCRVSFRNKAKTFSTGLKIPVQGWDAKRQIHTKRSERAKVINQQIDSWKSKVLVAKDELLKRESYFSVEDIISKSRGGLANVLFLSSVYENYVKEHKEPYVKSGKLSKALLNKHKRTIGALKDYTLEKYKRKDIDLRMVDYSFLAGFKTHLVTHENLCTNTALKHMQRLREVFLFCSSNGWISKDPFKSFKFRFEDVDRAYLNESELKTVEEFNPPNQSLQLAKDVFLFACYTGLSYSDIKKLTMANIRLKDGEPKLHCSRQKTKVESYIPLLPGARTILRRYELCPERTLENRALPVRSNQKSNAYLKVLMDLCGIPKEITFHCARHTFATLMLTKGVSMDSVSRMLGHKNLRTTQIYGRILNERVDLEMKRFMDSEHPQDSSDQRSA